MIALRTRFLAVLVGWLVAVASVAAIASFAINTAGRQVTAGPVSAPRPLSLAPTTAPAITQKTTETSTSRPRPKHKPKVSRQAEPIEEKTHTGGVAKSTTATPAPLSSTYSTIGGRVRVGCSGRRITLDGGYVQPESGWAVTVQSSGPDVVQVLFTQEGRRSLKVVAICLEGRPRFGQSRLQRVQEDDRNDDNDNDTLRNELFGH